MEENESTHVCSTIASFFLGGLVGAGVALLVAPQSGKETREHIRGLADTAKGKADDYYDQVKEAVAWTLENGKGLLDEKKQLITKAVQAGIEMYEQKKQEKTAASSQDKPAPPI
jgi:gas vesicle protein